LDNEVFLGDDEDDNEDLEESPLPEVTSSSEDRKDEGDELSAD
jgi:hypothetical protein